MTMLLTIVSTILPLAAAVVVGVLLGKRPLQAYRHHAGTALIPTVWVILWVIGVSAGEVLGSFSQSLNVLKIAGTYALSTSLCILFILAPILSIGKAPTESEPISLLEMLKTPLKESLIAFSIVGLGVFCAGLNWQHSVIGAWLIDIDLWLYLLLFLIGLELSATRIDSSWLSPSILIVPILAVAASLLGGVIASFILQEKLTTALALSSGFGWFSLSGALASHHLGEAYAPIALFTDLMRELLGILFVFLLGAKFPKSSIAVCGATAADTTLPFIRKACGAPYVPLALMSGLVLTLCAPFLMLIFMSL